MRVIFVKNANQTGSDMIDMLQVVGKDKRRNVYATIHSDFFFPNTSRIYKALERPLTLDDCVREAVACLCLTTPKEPNP